MMQIAIARNMDLSHRLKHIKTVLSAEQTKFSRGSKLMFKVVIAVSVLATSMVAHALDITYANNELLKCDEVHQASLYHNGAVHIHDRLNASGESYVSAKSSVRVYVKDGKMEIPDMWVQPTSYAPKAGKYYVIWNNGLAKLNLEKLEPKDRKSPVAQVVFNIRRANQSDGGKELVGSYYTAPFTDGGTPQIIDVSKDKPGFSRKFDLDKVYAEKLCYNFFARWCGDGVKDAEEECDPLESGSKNSCSKECRLR